AKSSKQIRHTLAGRKSSEHDWVSPGVMYIKVLWTFEVYNL
ncbi:hypothetical protein M2135_002675, partial [Parabacteroides sp. PF5-9]|nr:hypothetical protein [Parabacteroides sp. PF5-9]